jgi:hypothetical protein
MFVFYMSTHRKKDGSPLISATIDGYVSHVIFYLIDYGIIDSTADFRCPSTSRLLQALTLQDAQRLGPLRLRINIAVSLPIIRLCLIQAPLLFPCLLTQRFITAAMYLGFALSLRPDDYLRPDSRSTHRVCAFQLAFWFPSGYINIHDVHLYPPQGTRPLRLSFLPDFDKANRLGALTMRACAANPSPSDPCFIQYLFEFFRRYPPPSDMSPVFSALPPHIDLYLAVNSLLKHTAPTIGLSPSQLLPRGLRGGATAHVRGSGGTDSDAKLTGGWRSDAHDVYKRANFAPSDRCAASMHDNSADDLSLISYVHTVPKP